MLKWPENLRTQIAGLDMQHKQVVAILDKLCAVIKEQEPDNSLVNELLNQLTENETQYFANEQKLIQEVNATENLVSLQHMSHCSFVYDIEKIRTSFSPEIDIMQPENAETIPTSQMLEMALKVRNQYDNRNTHFKQQLAKCFIEQQLTDCLHKNITAPF